MLVGQQSIVYWFIVTFVPFSAIVALAHLLSVNIWKNRRAGTPYGRIFRWWMFLMSSAALFLMVTVPILIVASVIGFLFVFVLVSLCFGFTTLISGWLAANSCVVETIAGTTREILLDFVEAQARRVENWFWSGYERRHVFLGRIGKFFDFLRAAGIAILQQCRTGYRAAEKRFITK